MVALIAVGRRCCSSSVRWRSRSIRRYVTKQRSYDTAVAALNTLQSNSSILQTLRANRHEMYKEAIPQMVEWCKKAGYQPSDFDKLNLVHIAGTKGKGSTGAFTSSILAQYLPTKLSIDAERLPTSIGLYTSPHLRFVRERIQINNEFLDEERFTRYFYEIWDRLETSAANEGHLNPSAADTKPVYFRYLTLMALHCYMQEEIGAAVIECGIGGEYDSTNILVEPIVTGITSLGIDHTPLLGDTIEKIAWHKAGILKPNVPAFTAPQRPSALAVLHERARERGTAIHVAPEFRAIDDIELGLRGKFKKTNASLAVSLAATHLQRMGYSNLPNPLDADAHLPAEFITGLEQAKLGGRCEKRLDTTNSTLTWYLDGAHTADSLQAAAEWYVNELAHSRRGRKVLIFNQQSRDRAGLVGILFDTLAQALETEHPFKDVIFCSNTTYKQHGYKADLISINTDPADVDSLSVQNELAEIWRNLDSTASVKVVPTIEEAIDQARVLAHGQTADVLLTGSLHLVGGAIEVLETCSEDK